MDYICCEINGILTWAKLVISTVKYVNYGEILQFLCKCNETFTPHQDLEEQLEEEESARQRLLLEKVTLDTKVKSLETDLMNAVEQRDRLSKVKLFMHPVQKTCHTVIWHQPRRLKNDSYCLQLCCNVAFLWAGEEKLWGASEWGDGSTHRRRRESQKPEQTQEQTRGHNCWLRG